MDRINLCVYVFECSKVCVCILGWTEEEASPLALFPGPVLLGPVLVHLPELQEPVSWPALPFLPAGLWQGGLDKHPPPCPWGTVPSGSRAPLFSLASACLSLKRAPGPVQLGEVGKGSDWRVVSVTAAISIMALSSAGNSCTRLPQQVRTGVPCPSPACPSCTPPPTESHSHPSPDAGDRLGQVRDTLSFPSLLPLPGVTPTSSPSFTPSTLSPQDLVGVGAGGVDRRGVDRRLNRVGLSSSGKMV